MRMRGAMAPALVGLALAVALPVRGDTASGMAASAADASAPAASPADTGTVPSRPVAMAETAPSAPSAGAPIASDQPAAARDNVDSPLGVAARSGADSVAIPEVLALNAANPGEPFDLKPHVVPGQITIVDFYSVYCPPCMRIAPHLERLAEARRDIVLRKVDINRKGVRGIDWGSPLARQYRLQSIPHFKIYGPDGVLLAEGDQAMAMIVEWLRAE